MNHTDIEIARQLTLLTGAKWQPDVKIYLRALLHSSCNYFTLKAAMTRPGENVIEFEIGEMEWGEMILTTDLCLQLTPACFPMPITGNSVLQKIGRMAINRAIRQIRFEVKRKTQITCQVNITNQLYPPVQQHLHSFDRFFKPIGQK
jgi:hypothetical protein